VSAKEAFLGRLIDDAGLFPPASLDVASALAVDARVRAGAYEWIVGRFVAPAAKLGEIDAALRRAAPGAVQKLPLSAIVDAAHVARDVARIAEALDAPERRIDAASLELRLPTDGDGDLPRKLLRMVAEIDASGLPRATAIYLEFPFGPDFRAHMATIFDAIAGARAHSLCPVFAKMRCGGVTADAVPAIDDVAIAIGTLRALGIPFKATAGLHHPVRGRVESAGFVMHGFLNVIGAALLDHALDLDERTRHAVVGERRAAAFRLGDGAFAWGELEIDAQQIAQARTHAIHSFGSCSVDEPVDDLKALGVLT
jgi:hypothetical protein